MGEIAIMITFLIAFAYFVTIGIVVLVGAVLLFAFLSDCYYGNF